MDVFCYSGVYAIVNLLNGKIYIGSAVVLTRRLDDHFRMLRGGYHSNPHLQNAWNKYTGDQFDFTVIEYCDPDKCVEREQYWIDKLEPYKNENGYNRSPTAGSNLGFNHSEETKEKMSERMSGVPMEDYVKDKIREALTGKEKSAEHRANIWKNRQGWKHSEGSKRRISEGIQRAIKEGRIPGVQVGYKHSEETKAKMSASGKGRVFSEEHKAKIAAAVKAARARKKWGTKKRQEFF